MKLIGLMPARNEDWVLALSARAAMMWCDELIILDHSSVDRTADICQELRDEYTADRVSLIRFTDPTWHEMAHRQALLEKARAHGATHIAIVDADEVLTGNLVNHIRPHIEQLTGGRILQLPWTCLAPGPSADMNRADGTGRYYTAGVWSTNWVTTAFADQAGFGWQASGPELYDFHKRHPAGSRPDMAVQVGAQGQGGLMHLQFSSRRRLKAKQAFYKITEQLRWPGRLPLQDLNAMYNRAVYESDPLTTPTGTVPAAWWEPYEKWMQYLHVDAEPWQERAVQRAIAEHGREKFAGLDLFDVDFR